MPPKVARKISGYVGAEITPRFRACIFFPCPIALLNAGQCYESAYDPHFDVDLGIWDALGSWRVGLDSQDRVGYEASRDCEGSHRGDYKVVPSEECDMVSESCP